VPARGGVDRQAHPPRARRDGFRQRPPRDRGGVQGVRASAARGDRARPDGDRRAVHQGPLVNVAILNYGMGNLRSAAMAFEPVDAANLKVPQIGWNEVTWRPGSALGVRLGERTAMYHVHSYSPRPTDPEVIAGSATYGNEFTSAVEDGNLFGVQFHPEKSS